MDTATLSLGEWTLRYHAPPGDGPHPVLLLLHGWTGDENVMWVFAQRLSRQYLILSPRGLYPAAMGGYGWYDEIPGAWPEIKDFQPSIQKLVDLLKVFGDGHQIDTGRNLHADLSNLSLMGFSQGAALSYTFSLVHPQLVQRIAGLAGFMPVDAASRVGSRPLEGKPVYVAHGTHDELVPIERARLAVQLLEQAGAQVTYCEADVGHKLSLPCLKGLEKFFN